MSRIYFDASYINKTMKVWKTSKYSFMHRKITGKITKLGTTGAEEQFWLTI